MAKVISISCLKGGVGKTTTALSLGGIISREEKVLLVDLDPQANLTKSYFEDDFERTIYEAFKDRKNLPVVNVKQNLDLVPSCVDACGIETEFQAGAESIGRELILRNLLAPVKDKYDWIIIDCPAQLGVATANALVAADRALIPMCCDAYSANGLIQIINFINMVQTINDRLSILGILVTRFRQSRRVDKDVLAELRESAGEELLTSLIRENTALVKAPTDHKDIWDYDPKSIGARDYERLFQEIVSKF